MDKMIDQHVKKLAGDAPSSQTPAVSASAPRKSWGPAPYSREDEDHLVEYIAAHGSMGRLVDERFWQALDDKVGQGSVRAFAVARPLISSTHIPIPLQQGDLPWVKRHPGASWHAWYQRNADCIDRAVRRQKAGDYLGEGEVLRPKATENPRVETPSTATRVVAGRPQMWSSKNAKQSDVGGRAGRRKPASPPIPTATPKRPHTNEPQGVEERTVKKTRVESSALVDQHDDHGPPARSQIVAADEGSQDNGMDTEEPRGWTSEIADADGPLDSGDSVFEPDEEDEGAREKTASAVGSDDYRNEISDSPPVSPAAGDNEAALAGRWATTSGDPNGQDELDESLGSDGTSDEGGLTITPDGMEVDKEDDSFADSALKGEDVRCVALGVDAGWCDSPTYTMLVAWRGAKKPWRLRTRFMRLRLASVILRNTGERQRQASSGRYRPCRRARAGTRVPRPPNQKLPPICTTGRRRRSHDWRKRRSPRPPRMHTDAPAPPIRAPGDPASTSQERTM